MEPDPQLVFHAAGSAVRRRRPGAALAACLPFRVRILGAVHKVGLAQWIAGGICRLDASLREC